MKWYLHFISMGRQLQSRYETYQAAFRVACEMKSKLGTVTGIFGPEIELSADEVEYRYQNARIKRCFKPD